MGYVGPIVSRRLRESNQNLHLTGVDMAYFGHCLMETKVLPEYLIDVQYFTNIRYLPPKLLENIDAVIHLAAISNDPIGHTFENATYDINLNATVHLANLAKRVGVKSFVYASSCSMYGSGSDAPRKEDSELSPLTAYAISKVNAEKEISKLADEQFAVTSLRFSTACGMSPRMRLDLVLNDFIASALVTQKIQVLSDGSPWRPLIHIEDMASAIDWAVNRKNYNGGDFVAVNVGTNEFNYNIGDLAQACAEFLPGTSVGINKNAIPDKRSYRVNFNLYKKLAPSYQPKFDLEKSIKNIVNGLRKVGFRDPNFRKSTFIRLISLKRLLEDGLIDNSLNWIQK